MVMVGAYGGPRQMRKNRVSHIKLERILPSCFCVKIPNMFETMTSDVTVGRRMEKVVQKRE